MVIGERGEDLKMEQAGTKTVVKYEYLAVTVSVDGKDNKDIIKNL